jgi:hypothetical protein
MKNTGLIIGIVAVLGAATTIFLVTKNKKKTTTGDPVLDSAKTGTGTTTTPTSGDIQDVGMPTGDPVLDGATTGTSTTTPPSLGGSQTELDILRQQALERQTPSTSDLEPEPSKKEPNKKSYYIKQPIIYTNDKMSATVFKRGDMVNVSKSQVGIGGINAGTQYGYIWIPDSKLSDKPIILDVEPDRPQISDGTQEKWDSLLSKLGQNKKPDGYIRPQDIIQPANVEPIIAKSVAPVVTPSGVANVTTLAVPTKVGVVTIKDPTNSISNVDVQLGTISAGNIVSLSSVSPSKFSFSLS